MRLAVKFRAGPVKYPGEAGRFRVGNDEGGCVTRIAQPLAKAGIRFKMNGAGEAKAYVEAGSKFRKE